ncbi:hypothetical protein EBX93_10620 [bacterium]|nr:hypothetical protein [bacterium]
MFFRKQTQYTQNTKPQKAGDKGTRLKNYRGGPLGSPSPGKIKTAKHQHYKKRDSQGSLHFSPYTQ